jgi:hypothetical protein
MQIQKSKFILERLCNPFRTNCIKGLSPRCGKFDVMSAGAAQPHPGWPRSFMLIMNELVDTKEAWILNGHGQNRPTPVQKVGKSDGGFVIGAVEKLRKSLRDDRIVTNIQNSGAVSRSTQTVLAAHCVAAPAAPPPNR